MVWSSSWGKIAVTVPNVHLEMVKMVNFMRFIFCHSFKSRILTKPFEQHKHPIHPQAPEQGRCLKATAPVGGTTGLTSLETDAEAIGQDPRQASTRDRTGPGTGQDPGLWATGLAQLHILTMAAQLHYACLHREKWKKRKLQSCTPQTRSSPSWLLCVAAAP